MSIERRKSGRTEVRLKAGFSILFPEDTFQPIVINATVLDLSESGMLVRVTLPQEVYASMLKKLRYCRVTLQEPGLPQKLTGQSAWIAPEIQDEGVQCKLGLFFDGISEKERSELRGYIHELLCAAETRKP